MDGSRGALQEGEKQNATCEDEKCTVLIIHPLPASEYPPSRSQSRAKCMVVVAVAVDEFG